MKRIQTFLISFLTKLGFIRKPDFLAETIPDHPDKENLRVDIISIVGGAEYQKWAYFRCPCGCGEIIMLSLAKAKRPNWSIKIDFLNRPTVYPSIRQISGCKNHFWIIKGCVKWCEI